MLSLSASAPGKLMLLGEHAVVYGQPCLVTAVSQRMQAVVTSLDEPFLEIEAPEVQLTGYRKHFAQLAQGEVPKAAAFVETAVRNFWKNHPFHGGVHVRTQSAFSSQFGFGSSSAAAVCVVHALSQLHNLHLPHSELFDLAYKTVLDVQKKGSGFDVAAAVYGGTLLFRSGGVLLERLDVPPLPLVVGYSGIKADTVTLIDKVKTMAENDPVLVDGIYTAIGGLVLEGKTALEKGDWKTLGNVMDRNQAELQKLDVSIPKLDAMIAAAREAGAYGAKLSGAGGGDCMIALVPEAKRKAVADAIEAAGGQVMDVEAGAEGVRLE